MIGDDLTLMLLSYGYIIAIIMISTSLEKSNLIPMKISRKILHSLIGNLIFVIPFFTFYLTPFLVSSPFILVTFLASPISPYGGIREKMKGLAGITEGGHITGLILYSISYSVLALLFPNRPYVIASGIFPMAYGDSFAAVIGERYGKHKLWGNKSLIGSLTMFFVSLFSVIFSLFYFADFYSFDLSGRIWSSFITAFIVTVAELLTPKGYDNITVPMLGAAAFMFSGGY